MKKYKDSIMTAAPVVALNQDKAVLKGNMLVQRQEGAEIGKWWVMYNDGREAFMSEKDYLISAHFAD